MAFVLLGLAAMIMAPIAVILVATWGLLLMAGLFL
jgi:hypothetical protein